MNEVGGDRWEQAVEWPLTAAALLFLVAYAWPILDQELAPEAVLVCSIVTWAAWTGFALDHTVRLILSRDRARFVRSNVLDLLVVALPVLRPLRLLRLSVCSRC